MKAVFLAAPLALIVALPAQGQIYRCTDAEGNVVISNLPPGQGCKRVATDPITTMQPPASTSARPKLPSTTPSPAGFPKVDADSQRARDSDRRRILEQEMASEQKNLDDAKRALTEQEGIRNGDERNYQKVLDRLKPFQDKVALHERNIEQLRRELNNLR